MATRQRDRRQRRAHGRIVGAALVALAWLGCRTTAPSERAPELKTADRASTVPEPPAAKPLAAVRAALREFQLIGEAGAARVEAVSGAAPAAPAATRFVVSRALPHPWDLQAGVRNPIAIERGDRLLLRFKVRCQGQSWGACEGKTEATFERASAPFTQSVAYPVSATSTYREYLVPFVAAESYAPGEAYVLFRLGFAAQTLELSDVELANYGASVPLSALPKHDESYAGREPDAAWRQEADRRIDRLRRASLTVTLRDRAGRPMPGVRASLNMVRHQFGFGAAVGDYYLATAPDDADKARYEATIREWFNVAVPQNGLKWPALAGDWGPAFGRERAARLITRLRERGLSVRGHTLVWPAWSHTPPSVQALRHDPVALQRAVLEHITTTATAFADSLAHWDVVNEPYTSHELTQVLGPSAMAEWFQAARRAAPKAQLFINDYGILSGGAGPSPHRDFYAKLIGDLIRQGAPLDGIGMQGHFEAVLTPPEAVLRELDRFAAFGRPIWITEFDLEGFDDALSADYMRDFLTAIFSHPGVGGFVVWGLWEGEHPESKTPIFRKDWTLKGSGRVYRELVFQRWWTREEGASDAAGKLSWRPYLGDHELKVSWPGGEKVVRLAVSRSEQVDLTLP